MEHIDWLVRDCSNSIANALELLQSCTKLSRCSIIILFKFTTSQESWTRFWRVMIWHMPILPISFRIISQALAQTYDYTSASAASLKNISKCCNCKNNRSQPSGARIIIGYTMSELIQGLRPAKERRRYKVTPSLLGWAQTWNQPCYMLFAWVNFVTACTNPHRIHGNNNADAAWFCDSQRLRWTRSLTHMLHQYTLGSLTSQFKIHYDNIYTKSLMWCAYIYIFVQSGLYIRTLWNI